MNIEKLTEHINNLTSEEQHAFIKDKALDVNNCHKRMRKALKNEMATHTHCSRARRTTLYANANKITDSYNESTKMLKLAISIIL